MRVEFTEKAKSVMRYRSGGVCEVHTPDCRSRAVVFHHRLMRSHGGKGYAANGLYVCGPCHLYIHANPKISYEEGWLIRSGALVVDNAGQRLER